MAYANYVTVPISKDSNPETFTVHERYRIIRKVGSGSYGTVCSAFDLQDQQYCAIKKVYRVFDKRLITKRCLREMKLLRLFNNHPRIIQLFDMDTVYGSNEIYLVFGCMDASLHDVIHSQQPLDTVHAQWFMFQLLSGLNYIHKANVIHRDLKPANVLVNKDCDLRICDFGMARSFDQADTASYLTEYVTTRWYRAPEVMISSQSYSKAIDIWSMGCIFAEILERKVLFQGRDYIDQLHKILGILGLPKDVSFWDPSESVLAHIHSICTTDGLPPPTEPVDFHALFPACPAEGIHLLTGLLQLDPSRRLTVEDAFKHPYLSTFADPVEESLKPPPSSLPGQYDFEKVNNDDVLRDMVIHEIESFKHQLEKERIDMEKRMESSASDLPRRYHTMAADSESYCTTPAQKLNQLPSATMSLLESSHTTAAAAAASNIGYTQDAFVSEPEELGDDENYSYLCQLMKSTPGIPMDPDREFCKPEKGVARDALERALTGTW
ncbi:CMGC/MAPK/ERK protein kinase [Helicostylum pulchrum]|nr:CMGC/MAPK/ERK protein kinase [Helicostylum pulchrum]